MVLKATPTGNDQPLRPADFSSLASALDYAALGRTGSNYHTGRGELYAVVTYTQLREQSLQLARRLQSLGLERGARLAIVSETHPDFLRFFFACQYAGLIPVPMPIPLNLGGHKAYVAQIRAMLQSCRASVAMTPEGFKHLLGEALQGLELDFWGTPADYDALDENESDLCPLESGELAYLQYTSGSTRFPRGVMITQRAVMSNLASIITEGLAIRSSDRCVSWLPFYHDMGLVGLVLAPLASQLTVDYLGTREFAMRPRQWLSLLSRNRGTIAFSPPFGYELCNRRLREGEAEQFDLSSWRVAGVGAETIRPQVLHDFAETLRPSGFDGKAFLACYGMAECSLAVSFAPLDSGLKVDAVDAEHLAVNDHARPPADSDSGRLSEFVDCGRPLSEYEVEIWGANGEVLPERRIGVIHVRAPSVMSGYFDDPVTTAETLSADGWLNTGDIGYHVGDNLVITGRSKDLIIINGRNIWPQDLEQLAELQPEVRPGDALAFAVPGTNGADVPVMVVQCRETDKDKRHELIRRLQGLIHVELGVDCHIELAPLHTLPRTSSGKLSRSKARLNFIEAQLEPVGSPLTPTKVMQG